MSLNVTRYRDVPQRTAGMFCEKALFPCTSDQFENICKKKKIVFPTQLKLTKYSETVFLKKSLKDIKKIIKSNPARDVVDDLEELQYAADAPVTSKHSTRTPRVSGSLDDNWQADD